MPFKGLGAPKRRLAAVLALAERRALARAMLADVLAALGSSDGIDRVLLVSRDPAALELAGDFGAEPLAERGPTGYRAAAEQAAAAAQEGGASALLVLPADVPLVTPADIERVLHASHSSPLVLVPSRRGEGTNALLARPSGAIPFRFGRNSFAAHRRAAERRGITPTILELPNLALDLDEPGDLRALLDEQAGRTETVTLRYLRELGLDERLG